MVNTGMVVNVVGVLLMLLGGFMLTALPFYFLMDNTGAGSQFYAAVTTILTGLTAWFLCR